MRDICSDNMISKCHTKEKKRYAVKEVYLFNVASSTQYYSRWKVFCAISLISVTYILRGGLAISHNNIFISHLKSSESYWLIERCKQKLLWTFNPVCGSHVSIKVLIRFLKKTKFVCKRYWIWLYINYLINL